MRAFLSWLKVTTTAFTFKTLLRHYAKQVLTPRSRGLLRDYEPSDGTFSSTSDNAEQAAAAMLIIS